MSRMALGADGKEIIMPFLGASIIGKVLDLVREFLEERQSQREFTMKLLDKTDSTTLIERLINQYIDENDIRLENLRWWQARFRALGDVFDGDAWERLAEMFEEFGIKLPEDPPEPPS